MRRWAAEVASNLQLGGMVERVSAVELKLIVVSLKAPSIEKFHELLLEYCAAYIVSVVKQGQGRNEGGEFSTLLGNFTIWKTAHNVVATAKPHKLSDDGEQLSVGDGLGRVELKSRASHVTGRSSERRAHAAVLATGGAAE